MGKAQVTPQGRAFIKTAREIGCDEDAAAFKERLKKLVSAPSQKSAEKPKVKKSAK